MRNYIHYCTENQEFIREVLGLKSFTSPFGIIIIGRESELKKIGENSLIKHNLIEILTIFKYALLMLFFVKLNFMLKFRISYLF